MKTNKYHLSYRGFLTILFFIALVMVVFAEPIANTLALLFYKFLFQFVPLCWRFQTAKTAWAWLSFSLHENEQKIKPANGFFTEMTYLERSDHLRSKLPQSKPDGFASSLGEGAAGTP